MRRIFYSLVTLLALVGCGVMYLQSEIPVKAQAVQRCTVSDPTGTELNIRLTPNGKKVVGKLKNGTRVAFDTESGDGQDRSWAYVRLDKKNSKPLGWVLREYLECD